MFTNILVVSRGNVKKELTPQHPHVLPSASINFMRAKQIFLKFDTGILPVLISRFQTRLKSHNNSAHFAWRFACVSVHVSKPARSVHLHGAKNVVNTLCRENETHVWRPFGLQFKHYCFRYN